MPTATAISTTATWAQRFNYTGPIAINVPEPGSAALLMLGLLATRRRHRA